MKNHGQTLKIFLADGVSHGLKIIEKSNWVGKCIACSRTQFQNVKSRPEFSKTGIYVIYGTDFNNLPTIYIGEGDPVLNRLSSHDREKDFWEQLIIFTSKDENLNKAHIQYLESRLVELAQSAKMSKLENGNSPAQPALSESDRADMEAFLENMILIFGVLGLQVFEKPNVQLINSSATATELKLKGPNAQASGYETFEGFIVLKGSKAQLQEANSIPAGIKNAREQMLADGVFKLLGDSYILTQDYTFSSPSKAAAIFLARNANGRTEWRSEAGLTLKSIQEAS